MAMQDCSVVAAPLDGPSALFICWERWEDWGHYLVRTDPDAPKHRGISYFIIDMNDLGITPPVAPEPPTYCER